MLVISFQIHNFYEVVEKNIAKILEFFFEKGIDNKKGVPLLEIIKNFWKILLVRTIEKYNRKIILDLN